MPGEIFDIEEEKFDVQEYINGNTDYWCLSSQLSPIPKWTISSLILTWKCWCNVNN
jgi:hypothetical protein